MLDVLELTRKLVEIPSVTGQEGKVGAFLHSLLQGLGWRCVRQPVDSNRFNVLATRKNTSVILTTHMDTVPPFFSYREDEQFIYGRGVCDAKGIAAAMICAAQGLKERELDEVALLFVVGEETDSAGARQAAESDLRCSFLVNGEPTDNTLAIGHKGIVYARCHVEGRAAHSAYPEEGESAIHKLVDLLTQLKEVSFPADGGLGESHLNVGLIRGGRAANVIADHAEAEILIRTVAESQLYIDLLRDWMGEEGHLEILKTSEPQVMEPLADLPSKVVGYGTDIPCLRALGRPLLLGPGSILEAHTAGEKIAKQELYSSVDLYQQVVRLLLARVSN